MKLGINDGKDKVLTDQRFMDTAVNALYGMMSGVNFEDVFEVVQTAKSDEDERRFNIEELALSIAAVIMEITNRIDAVHRVAETLLTIDGYKKKSVNGKEELL